VWWRGRRSGGKAAGMHGEEDEQHAQRSAVMSSRSYCEFFLENCGR
jgi:hypothetical protein